MKEDYARQVAIVMASLELLPAQPSDLTGILRDPEQFHALMHFEADPAHTDLIGYLRDSIENTRVEHWHKQIDLLMRDSIATPILAANISGAPTYPARLARCWDAPPVLFATAPVEQASSRPAVAIIGSRTTSQETLAATHRLAADLAATEISIVSGLALGVDAAAHEGALSADGHTVAVLGTGIRRIYPAQNEALASRIRKAGTIVSQFAPNAPRTRTSFLRRNHVIAGLSDISIIMAGKSRSGSRHEIEQAMGYDRTILMWGPALQEEPWAQSLASSQRASYITCADDVRAALERIDN